MEKSVVLKLDSFNAHNRLCEHVLSRRCLFVNWKDTQFVSLSSLKDIHTHVKVMIFENTSRRFRFLRYYDVAI